MNYTHKNFQGKGPGKKLVARAIDKARKNGVHTVQLTTDKQRPNAIEFYKKMGFRDCHEDMKLHLKS